MGGPELPLGATAPDPTGRISQSRYAGAVGLFVLGALTQYVGAALAVGLFGAMPAVTVAWWRIAIAAVVLLAWRRPWRGSREWWWRAAAFGLVLAGMNVSFYLAIDHQATVTAGMAPNSPTARAAPTYCVSAPRTNSPTAPA